MHIIFIACARSSEGILVKKPRDGPVPYWVADLVIYQQKFINK